MVLVGFGWQLWDFGFWVLDFSSALDVRQLPASSLSTLNPQLAPHTGAVQWILLLAGPSPALLRPVTIFIRCTGSESLVSAMGVGVGC